MCIDPKTSRQLHNKANKKLKRFCREHNCICYWCGEKVVHASAIYQQFKHVEIGDEWVVWETSDQILKGRKATIDHVIDIDKGGTNKDENLVLACASCNKKRNIEKQKPDPKNCIKCGKWIEKGRMCKDCGKFIGALRSKSFYVFSCYPVMADNFKPIRRKIMLLKTKGD